MPSTLLTVVWLIGFSCTLAVASILTMTSIPPEEACEGEAVVFTCTFHQEGAKSTLFFLKSGEGNMPRCTVVLNDTCLRELPPDQSCGCVEDLEYVKTIQFTVKVVSENEQGLWACNTSPDSDPDPFAKGVGLNISKCEDFDGESSSAGSLQDAHMATLTFLSLLWEFL